MVNPTAVKLLSEMLTIKITVKSTFSAALTVAAIRGNEVESRVSLEQVDSKAQEEAQEEAGAYSAS